jgi:hypothetical protein
LLYLLWLSHKLTPDGSGSSILSSCSFLSTTKLAEDAKEYSTLFLATLSAFRNLTKSVFILLSCLIFSLRSLRPLRFILTYPAFILLSRLILSRR